MSKSSVSKMKKKWFYHVVCIHIEWCGPKMKGSQNEQVTKYTEFLNGLNTFNDCIKNRQTNLHIEALSMWGGGGAGGIKYGTYTYHT